MAFAAVLGFLGGGRWPFLVLILPLVLPFWQVFRRRIWGLVWTFGSTFGTCLAGAMWFWWDEFRHGPSFFGSGPGLFGCSVFPLSLWILLGGSLAGGLLGKKISGALPFGQRYLARMGARSETSRGEGRANSGSDWSLPSGRVYLVLDRVGAYCGLWAGAN